MADPHPRRAGYLAGLALLFRDAAIERGGSNVRTGD